MSVTLTNLVDELVLNVEITKTKATEVLVAAFDAAAGALAAGEEVVIKDFGRISTRVRPSRKARNPKTGEEITTDPKIVTKFTPRGYTKELLGNAQDSLKD